jgi:hypothetical protein
MTRYEGLDQSTIETIRREMAITHDEEYRSLAAERDRLRAQLQVPARRYRKRKVGG